MFQVARRNQVECQEIIDGRIHRIKLERQEVVTRVELKGGVSGEGKICGSAIEVRRDSLVERTRCCTERGGRVKYKGRHAGDCEPEDDGGAVQ